MAATCLSIKPPNFFNLSNPPQPKKPFSFIISMHNLPKGLCKNASVTRTALAGAFFSTLSSSHPALAAKQIAETAEGDNRVFALLIPIVPAILWVLYNILEPALNQINRMRSDKGIIMGFGVGGLVATEFMNTPPQASAATEVVLLAESANDSRGQLLVFVIAPAIVWVLYNILQPDLNQINRMKS